MYRMFLDNCEEMDQRQCLIQSLCIKLITHETDQLLRTP
jgi:hypothetical protein